jgi:hypothetical protein
MLFYKTFLLNTLNSPICLFKHAIDLLAGSVFGAKGHDAMKIVQGMVNCKGDLG